MGDSDNDFDVIFYFIVFFDCYCISIVMIWF